MKPKSVNLSKISNTLFAATACLTVFSVPGRADDKKGNEGGRVLKILQTIRSASLLEMQRKILYF